MPQVEPRVGRHVRTERDVDLEGTVVAVTIIQVGYARVLVIDHLFTQDLDGMAPVQPQQLAELLSVHHFLFWHVSLRELAPQRIQKQLTECLGTRVKRNLVYR